MLNPPSPRYLVGQFFGFRNWLVQVDSTQQVASQGTPSHIVFGPLTHLFTIFLMGTAMGGSWGHFALTNLFLRSKHLKISSTIHLIR